MKSIFQRNKKPQDPQTNENDQNNDEQPNKSNQIYQKQVTGKFSPQKNFDQIEKGQYKNSFLLSKTQPISLDVNSSQYNEKSQDDSFVHLQKYPETNWESRISMVQHRKTITSQQLKENLIIKFIKENPDPDDIDEEEKLEFRIRNEMVANQQMFETLKTRASKDLKKWAGKYDISEKLLQQIVDEFSQIEDKIFGKAEQVEKTKIKNISVFQQDQESRIFLSQILEFLQDTQFDSIFQEQNEVLLESLIRQNDLSLKSILLRKIKEESSLSQKEIQKLDEFTQKNMGINFFKIFSIQDYSCNQIDHVINLQYLRYNIQQIVQDTGVDVLTVEDIQSCSEIYKRDEERSQTSSNFFFQQSDFKTRFAFYLYDIYKTDQSIRLRDFNLEIITQISNKKNIINLEQFRRIDLIQMDDIKDTISKCKNYEEIYKQTKQLIILYIQCSLPLDKIKQMIQQKFGKWKEYQSINPTAQDLFDLVLNQSEDNVKALILERYSSVYPIPFFISDYQNNVNQLYYHLAYFMKPCKTMLSFGIMKASWTKCGKSTLIDEIFSTDFTGGLKGDQKLRMGQNSEQVVSSGNNIKLYPSRGKYELGRIDIQLARNIDAHEPETKWQYIDASRFCDPSIIDHLCYKVNVILLHVLAKDIMTADFKELTQKIQKIVTYKKRTIIFVRDVDAYQSQEEIKIIDSKILQLQKLNIHNNIKFVMIQSILLKEIPNQLPLSFEESLQQAFETIKEHVVKYDYKHNQVFDHMAIARLYSEIHKCQLSDQGNILYKDHELVEKIIRGIEKTLKNQIVVIDQKQKQIQKLINEIYDSKVYGKNSTFDNEKLKSIQKIKYMQDNKNIDQIFIGKEAQINEINALVDEISQNFISDKILLYFSKYQKHQKYQSEINVIINDSDFRNGQLYNKLQENQFKNQIRDEKILKINKIYSEIQAFQKSDIIQDFISLLNQDRSLLLIWILTERLYYESNNNDLWKQFLLNQEVFDKNLCEFYKDQSLRLNIDEMQSILKKDKPQHYEEPNEEYSDYQLSIFDFFRELILLVFYSQETNQVIAKKIDQKSQMLRIKDEQFFAKIKSGFSQYAQTGESFELIDGEYLRIHDLELSKLMSNFIKKIQQESKVNAETRFYVISQIGRQSVGKSFLFNHMFKTKFLNRSGRCTQGINMAIRNLKNDIVKSNFTKNDKLLILDTEGLGSLDKVKRLRGKDINFDRCMVLFCLTVSNAMIITLKSEIDQETADLISVCCWALSNLKIHKMSPPHIYFVLNQQADCQQKNYMRGLNACIEQILDNPLYNKENIRENIHIKKENFFVLPSAFDQDPRNYKRLYGYHVQRSIIRPLFTEMCQSLAKKIIKTIDEDARTKLMNFENLMKMAGDSFRTITQFPELLRYQNVNEYFCNNRLREKVQELMNLNQIMTSGYHQINQTIINKIHMTDLKQIKNTPEYIDEIIEPLEEKYTQNYQNLKQQFQQFSQNEEFKNYPEIIKLNEQILSKHCVKQLQFFKNIILDLLKIKQQQKLQKKMEDNVNEQIRKITDELIKTEKIKWWDIFEKIWNEQEQIVYKNELQSNLDDVDYYNQLLDEQYHIFQLESMDNHRMNKQQIYEKFVMPFINQKANSKSTVINQQDQILSSNILKNQPKSKSIFEFDSLQDFQVKGFNCKDAIKQVIKDFENEIILIFQGQKVNNLNPNEVHVRFFEASSKKVPAGKLSQIHGKNQQQSLYISMDSLTETEDDNGTQKLIPSKQYKQEVHHLIGFLLDFKDDGQFVKEANMDVQAIILAENLRCIKDKKQILWKKFINDLQKKIQTQIKQQVEIQDQYIKKNNMQQTNQPQQTNRFVVNDETFQNKYNQKMIRSLDSSNIRIVMTEIQNMIQEAEFELGFIFVNFSVSARNYLNTLGFLYCLQNRIDREDKKIKQEKEQKENFRQQYFDSFEMRMQEKQIMKLKGLSKSEMRTSDDYKSNIFSKKLLDIIINEALDILQNSIQAQIDTQASIELSNRCIVKQINQKVKYRVSENLEEAKNEQDIGVKYIVDYHGLIEQTFDQRWQKIQNKIFEEAKLQYRNEIDNSIFQIVNQLKYILQEMKSLLVKNNIKFLDQKLNQSQEIDDEDDMTDKKTAEYFFQTNELFELQIQSMDFQIDSEKKLTEQSLFLEKKYMDHPQTPKLSLQHSHKRLNSIFLQNELLDDSPTLYKISDTKSNKDEIDLTYNKYQMKNTQFEIQMYGDMDEINKSMCFSDKALSIRKYSSVSQDELIDDNYSQNYLNQKFSNDIFKIPIVYLNWLFGNSYQGAFQITEQIKSLNDSQLSFQDEIQLFKYKQQSYKLKKKFSLPFFGQIKKKFQQNQPIISESNLKKLRLAGLFESQHYEIYNLYRFLQNLLNNLENSNEDIQLNEIVFQQLIHEQKKELEEKSKGCKERCPACNKYCEQEFNHRVGGGIHSPHSCSIYGHQFFSMGGRIWSAETNECILVQCHDKRLNDFQSIRKISEQKEKWIDFKNKNSEWVWDDDQMEEQDPENDYGLNFMIDLHNMCGQQAFEYYKKTLNVDIKFRKYNEEDKRSMRGLSKTKQICFVIDGTYSMVKDIQKVRKAIKNLTCKNDIHLELAVVIYRDHDYGDNLIEQFPNNYQFTNDRESIIKFLEKVKTDTQKGISPNEAALDGLAEAALYQWGNSREKDLMVIHIYDAQPHGDWPNFNEHHEGSGSDKQNCCCCKQKCQKDWKRDVFEKFKQLELNYHGVFTHEKNYTKNLFGLGRKRYNEFFDQVMQEELGQNLCKSNATTIVEKELVQIQINDIVIMERYDQK